MKKAMCIIYDQQDKVATETAARQFAANKGYKFQGVIVVSQNDILNKGDMILSILKNKQTDIVLTNNLVPELAQQSSNGSVVNYASLDGMDWIDFEKDYAINAELKEFIRTWNVLEKEQHCPLMVIANDPQNFKQSEQYKMIKEYAEKILNIDEHVLVCYGNEDHETMMNLQGAIFRFTPNHIIMQNEFRSEEGKSIVNFLNHNFDYDLFISMDEVEEELQQLECRITDQNPMS